MSETIKITPEDKRYLDEAIAKANSDIQEMRGEMAVAHSTAGDGLIRTPIHGLLSERIIPVE